MLVKGFAVIGEFRYREPLVRQTAKAIKRFPVVTLYADPRLGSLLPYFQQYINASVELNVKKSHKIIIEQVGPDQEKRFKLTIDGKKIVMISMT